MNAKNAYVIFTDLKGFSKLSEPEVKIFYSEVLNDLSGKIKQYKKHALIWNTWGDALLAIFEDECHAVNLALAYRDFFNLYNFEAKNIKKLIPRIAGHFGRFDIFDDPLLDSKNALGENINTTARIEPITRAGEIYVTEEFKLAVEKAPDKIDHIKFEEIGEIPLAKNFGKHSIFRLKHISEEEKIIDRILKQDLSRMLPEAESLSEEDSRNITYYKASPTPQILRNTVPLDSIRSDEELNENYLLELAKICKNFGLYEEAIEIIEKIETQFRNVDGVNIILYKYYIPVMKLKTNCLTRLGKYEDASNLIYGVWQLNNKDSDTLSMLAAQYKRRSLYGEGHDLLQKDAINTELLRRALSLYIEAFRLNIEDYYPAINIAYLYKIIGGVEEGKGIKLANYIQSAWKHEEGKDWWIDTTLLECEIISGDFENLDTKFQKIIEIHSPTFFEKKSTLTQIELFSQLVTTNDVLTKILKLLQG
jgi:tetratricopeptide (TPR) repeat protein